MSRLEDFLKPTQEELFRVLYRKYLDNAIAKQDKYILVEGEVPILLVAHLDTVHKEPVKTICTSSNGNLLMSPQGIGGDDRCGVYSLVKVYEESGHKPWLLFTCDEEIGGVGAKAFTGDYLQGKFPAGLDGLKMIVEIDRKGSHDAVYYDCGNDDFEEYITRKGFKTASGSFSDISIIAPELGVAAVNLSSGYYNAHSLHEYINRKELERTTNTVIGMVQEAADEHFPRYEFKEILWSGILHFPENLRDAYYEVYDMLLEYFSDEELESYREMYGNHALFELYESVFREDLKEGGSDIYAGI